MHHQAKLSSITIYGNKAKPLVCPGIISSIIYSLVIIFSLASYSSSPLAADTQQVSEAQLTKLKQSIKKVNRWLSHANTEKTGLSKQLEKLEKLIDKISREIRHSNAKITKHASELKSLQRKHREQEASLEKQQKYLIKQLQVAYLRGEQTELKMLLDTNNPQDIARQMHYFSYINDARNEKINKFKEALAEIKETETNILKQKKELSAHRQVLEKSREALRFQRKQRKELLVKLEKNIKTNSQRLNKMKADQQRLEKLLNELEIAIANIPLPIDAAPFYRQKSKLPRPSRGKVSARFGSRVAQGKLKLNGIHITTVENAPVTAVHYGRVIFSNWIRGFGLLIIIDHGDDYMSLYGNNKSLIKETGDWVRAGETIAYSSESNAKRESGLYFEIRKKGKPQNPSLWLRKR